MILIDLSLHTELLAAQATLYTLATASNIPTDQLEASDLDVLVAVHHVLNDSTLPVEKKHQFYESLRAGSKTHDWLDVCNHPQAWSILRDLSESNAFISANARWWNLDHFARGWTDFPLNATGVSHQHIPFYFLMICFAFKISMAFMRSAKAMYEAHSSGETWAERPHEYESWVEPVGQSRWLWPVNVCWYSQ